jgi:hypothetical protein
MHLSAISSLKELNHEYKNLRIKLKIIKKKSPLQGDM